MHLDCKRLSAAELEKAVNAFLAGCQMARAAIIEHHANLATHIASKYCDDDDIALEALLQLVVAVDKFPLKCRDKNITAFLSMHLRFACLTAIAKNRLIPVTKQVYSLKGPSVLATIEVIGDERKLKMILDKPPCRLEVRELLELCCDTEEDRFILFGAFFDHTLMELSVLLNRSIAYISTRRQKLYARFRYLWEKDNV